MIVIPMAGLSSRFFKVGYKVPKYMLPVGDETVFSLSVLSFKNYFSSDKFIFICRDVFDSPAFIASELNRLGVINYEIVILNKETSGQAETVILGLENYKEIEDLTIFNIDTFRMNFSKPEFPNDSVGYLETFIGSGKNWSNILPLPGFQVKKTAEKQEISEYCCTGLYHFSKLSYLREAFESAQKDPMLVHGGEFYIAPLYNFLIEKGDRVFYNVISKNDVIFCGTPDEYLAIAK